MYKKANSPTIKSGAPLIVIITLLILLYIIFLPPDQRAILLEGGSSPSAPGQPSERIPESRVEDFVFAGPGRLASVGRSSYEHILSSVRLSVRQEATVIHAANAFTVRRSAFAAQDESQVFMIRDPSLVSNVMLVFSTQNTGDILTIRLNGQTLFSSPINERQTRIDIPASMLMSNNIMEFSVDPPGWRFWSSNRYTISDLRIQGDVTDNSAQQSSATFSIRPNEMTLLERAVLEFVPECNQQEVGRVRGFVNDQLIFDGVPDCGIRNIHHIDKSLVQSGINTVSFSNSRGSVLLDRVRVITHLDEQGSDVTYFFDLSVDLFNRVQEDTAVCGVVDGICPRGCSASQDKDCCFEDFPSGYWCDLPTQNSRDRCVGQVFQDTIFRCPSGYADRHGRVPEQFEGICGDNNDGVCPIGCSRFYDKDCCLAQDRYWCTDLPLTGLADRCRDDMPADAAQLCPSGYRSNSGIIPHQPVQRNQISQLNPSYRIIASFVFVDDQESKEAELLVNGFTTNIQTRQGTFERDISSFVRDGSNYITIRPNTAFTLVEVRIKVERR